MSRDDKLKVVCEICFSQSDAKKVSRSHMPSFLFVVFDNDIQLNGEEDDGGVFVGTQ